MTIENRRARFEYEILKTFEAGISLQGWEVKSLRAGSANIRAAWVGLREDEAFLENFQISPWKFSKLEQPKNRSKKLLLHKHELRQLQSKSREKGVTIIPLKIFSKGNKLKCEIAIVRGRKKYEKRQVLKNRATEREARQALKNFHNR